MDETIDLNIIPKISDNIEIYPIDNNEYIIKQLQPEAWVKVKKELYNLICLIDNKSTIVQIAEFYKQQYKKKLEPALIYEILNNRLKQFCFIGEAKTTPLEANTEYLHLKFIIFPARMIKKILPVFFPLFNPKVFYILLISLTIFITGFYIYNFQDFSTIFQHLGNYEIVLLVVISFVSILFHEFGHAASCEYYNANHKGIGFGFYLLTPVFYADVTDAWKLSKYKRIMIDLSGVYFETIFTTTSIIIYLFTKENLFLFMPSIILLRIFINLNPFFRYDGYWILSDLVGIPNLRKKSFEKLKNLIRKLFIKNIILKGQDYFLAVYALITFALILLFLSYIIFINPNSIIKAPVYIFNFIKHLLDGKIDINIKQFVMDVLIPFLFYLLAINYIINSILKAVKKRKK